MEKRMKGELIRRMIRRFVPGLIWALGLLFLITGCSPQKGGGELRKQGLEYRFKEFTDPRPNRAHILRVDLARGKVRPGVVIPADPDGDGPAEVGLTNPLKLAAGREVLAFVNTNSWNSLPDESGKRNSDWYEGQPVDIEGLAASRGEIRSPLQSGFPSVWVDQQGRVFLGGDPSDRSIAEGAAGFRYIVKDGVVTASPGGGPIHPRTSIGLNREGSVLWLAVVDGRQEGYSEGMNLHELGCLMRDLGCSNALNMDGGGSSIIGLVGKNGKLQIMNSPSDRRQGLVKIRPLPMVFIIKKK